MISERAGRAHHLERAAVSFDAICQAAQTGSRGRVGAADALVGDLDHGAPLAGRDTFRHPFRYAQ